MRFLYVTIAGALVSNALLLFIEGFRELFALNITAPIADLMALTAVLVAVIAMFYIGKLRSVFYGISIAIFHVVVGGLIFKPGILYDSIINVPIYTLLIVPIPLMGAGLLGAFIGKLIRKK